MSASHDTHHSDEQKPVAFTVPLIMAAVLVLILVLFLSLCDPKPHHHGEAAHEGPANTEAMHHEAGHHDAAAAEHHEAPAVETMHSDSANAGSAESHQPEAEATAHH